MVLEAGAMITSNLRLVELLGEGGMGCVWVADNTSLETKVAVKFISAELARADKSLVSRFKREASTAAQLKSPHVVRIFDHGVMDDGTPFIVMELLDGQSLAERLVDAPLDLSEAALLIGQAAQVLSEAHQLGIVHRDLKADNLFLARSKYDMFVKVLDFGIAKRTRDRSGSVMTRAGTVVGTPEYMSPQQLLSSKDVDHRADLWAMGVVMYEALTGRLPFTGETLGAVTVAINRGDFTAPSALRDGLPAALDDWLVRALAADPDERFASAEEMAETFAAIAGAHEDSSQEDREPSSATAARAHISFSATERAPAAGAEGSTLSPASSTVRSRQLPRNTRPLKQVALAAGAAVVVLAVLVMLPSSEVTPLSGTLVAAAAATAAAAVAAPQELPGAAGAPQPAASAEVATPASAAASAPEPRIAPRAPRPLPRAVAPPAETAKPSTPSWEKDHGF